VNVLRGLLETVWTVAWAVMILFVVTWAPDVLADPPWRLATLLGGFVALWLSSFTFAKRRLWFDVALVAAAASLALCVVLVKQHWPLVNSPRLLLSAGFVNYVFWPWIQTALVLLGALITRIAGDRSRS